MTRDNITSFFSQFSPEDQQEIKVIVESAFITLHINGVQRVHVIILNLADVEVSPPYDGSEEMKERVFLAFLRRFPNLAREHVRLFTAGKRKEWNFISVVAGVDGDKAGNYLGVTAPEQDLIFAAGEILIDEQEVTEDELLDGCGEDDMPDACKTCKKRGSCPVHGTEEEVKANVAFFHPGSNAIN